jgi:hypothetical protein
MAASPSATKAPIARGLPRRSTRLWFSIVRFVTHDGPTCKRLKQFGKK